MPHLASPDTNLSFIKGLFLGQLREDLLYFPTLEVEEAENLRLIIDSLRAFAHEHVNSHQMDHDGCFPAATRAALHELGLMGLNIPQEHGGFGASAKVFTRIFGEMGHIDPALAVYFGAHQSIGCKGITLFGTPEQKAQWLPRCATGECVAAFCLTEPGSGSDAQAMTTSATPQGDDYLLTGRKIWISNAGYAGLFTVFALVPMTVGQEVKHKVTAFIVEATSPGITLGAPEQKMGIKASDTRTVTFDSVRVPAANILGPMGGGFKIALEILNSGRLGLASGSCHGTRRIMTHAIEYATTRTQFGRPISDFEMIQKKIALTSANLYAAESAITLAAHMMDRGGIDYSLEAAACKVFASELANTAASDAMQIAGGMGYSKEAPYEQAIRDTRINMIFEGTNEILRALVALSGVQEPATRLEPLASALHDPLHSIGNIKNFVVSRASRTLHKPKFAHAHPLLKKDATRLAALIQTFSLAVEDALLRHGRAIVHKQFVQERMADSAIGLYLACATISRTTWELNNAKSPQEAQEYVDCAKLFLSNTCRTLRVTIKGISKNSDKKMTTVALQAITSGKPAPRDPTDQ